MELMVLYNDVYYCSIVYFFYLFCKHFFWVRSTGLKVSPSNFSGLKSPQNGNSERSFRIFSIVFSEN